MIGTLAQPEQTTREKRKAKQYKALRNRKMEEAVDLISTCLESFAYYYYVQRRALMYQEVSMFDTNFCITKEHDWVSTKSPLLL